MTQTNESDVLIHKTNSLVVVYRKSLNVLCDSGDAKWVCSLAWIGQRPPEPLTRVQIPADPYFLITNTKLLLKLLHI